MEFIDNIKNKIKYRFLRLIKPEMIGYSRNKDRERLTDTRVSNITHISNPINVTLGNNVFVGHFNYIDGFDKVRIGEGAQITNYVSILTHSSHNSIRLYGEKYIKYWGTKMKGLVYGPVVIGEYSFIGPHSVIMPGTVIGKGCIVGAYSFVDGNFPDYSILRGTPAQIIGDTRKIDAALLEEFPEMKEFYYLDKYRNSNL